MSMMTPEQQGPAPFINLPPDQGQSDSGDGDLKQQILEMLRRAIAEDPDEEDKLAMEKCTTIIQQLLARDQQDTQKALGDTGLMRMMRKTG